LSHELHDARERVTDLDGELATAVEMVSTYRRKWEVCKDALRGESRARTACEAELTRVRGLVSEAMARRATGASPTMIDPLLRAILKGGAR